MRPDLGTGNAVLNMFGACCGTGFQLADLSAAPTLTSGGSAANSAQRKRRRDLEHGDMAQGQAHRQLRRLGWWADVWLEFATLAPRTNEHSSRRSRCSTPPTSRARRPPTSVSQAQNLYAMLTGRINSITANARINEAGDCVRPARQVARRGTPARVRLLRRRHLARRADADRQRRPALRTSWRTRSTRSTTATRQAAAAYSGDGNLFEPGTLTGSKPLLTQSGGHLRLQPGSANDTWRRAPLHVAAAVGTTADSNG